MRLAFIPVTIRLKPISALYPPHKWDGNDLYIYNKYGLHAHHCALYIYNNTG